MRRRSRSLTLDERRLWAQVAQSVTPFAGRAIEKELAPEAPPADDGATIGSPVRPQASEPLYPGRLQPLVPLERRTVSALRRGKQGIEAVVDLHGLRQSEAHRMLRGFLHRSQGGGLTIVLVITGKGTAGGDESSFGERGVLRRMVPHWLRLPDLRPLVAGFHEAAPHHGGAGALYVRLRRAARRDGP